MNAVNTSLQRLMPAAYSDLTDGMAGEHRPSPRMISNLVFAQDGSIPNTHGATDMVWQWGQFLDHDIDLTEGVEPPESFPISIPAGDDDFGSVTSMPFNRSIYVHDAQGVRQQLNEITGWIDASNVYGSDILRRDALRTLDGTGQLKVSADNLLPNNDLNLPNAGGDSDLLFLAGDVRANEQVGLTVLHTLFVREHNRLARTIRARDLTASGDEIFERARMLVASEIQHITYTEFLPVLLGRGAMRPYRRYRSSIDARIMNEFSTAAFRMGHSMLNPKLLRLDAEGETLTDGDLALRDAFFAPDEVRAYGIEPYLRGLSRQLAQRVDNFVVDDVRNFLFGPPGSGGFDLVSLNIQRGRDHGLPSYNEALQAMGFKSAEAFADISSDPEVVARLQAAYTSVEDVDIWVGGLSEDPYAQGLLGPLFHAIVRLQFERLRDGDRYWYEKVLSRKDLKRVKRLSLARIIRLNTSIGGEIQKNVFLRKPKKAKRPRSGRSNDRRRSGYEND